MVFIIVVNVIVNLMGLTGWINISHLVLFKVKVSVNFSALEVH